MANLEEIRTQCTSDNAKERIKAVELLKDNFLTLPDKQQAWDNLVKLTNDKDSDVKIAAIFALNSIRSNISDLQKLQAWKDITEMTGDNIYSRARAADVLRHAWWIHPYEPDFRELKEGLQIKNSEDSTPSTAETTEKELPIIDKSLKGSVEKDQRIIVTGDQYSFNNDITREQNKSKSKEITFIALRYSIIRSEQRTLTESKYLDTPECKVRLFVDLFLQNETTYITQYDSEYVLLDIENRDNIYCGIFAKKGIRNIPKKEGPHINERLTIEYPYVHFICDIQKNIFCIQKKSTVYDDPLKIINILSDMVTDKIKSEGYVCKFKTIDQKRAFWNTLKEAKKIYYLQLTLNSPNFLNANKIAREALKEIHEEYNTTTTDLTMENEEGKLKVVENDINRSYIEYAEEGGGSWTVKTDRGITRSLDKVFTLQKDFKNIFEVAEDIIHDVNSVLKYK